MDSSTIDLSPDEFRRLGHVLIDLLADQLAGAREAPVRRPLPEAVRDRLLNAPLNDAPEAPDALLQRVKDDMLPYSLGNSSPRFFGWVNSPPAPLGILGDLLAAGQGSPAVNSDRAAYFVEMAVVGWIRAMFGLPETTGGILTSGGTAANVIGLAAMRHMMAQGNMRRLGMTAEPARMVLYTSTQAHSCLQKAAELLGFGDEHLRRIPVDSEYRMDVAALREAVGRDRANGLRPVCVAASAGTVNTGAVDPLDAIADLCADEAMWFHIDGAYGGFGILSPAAAPLFKGIERADSLAVDPHKWLYAPIEAGCALVRDGDLLRAVFGVSPAYLNHDSPYPWLSDLGIQQTRGFKALKIWLVLQQVGLQGFRDLISADIAHAKALQAKIKARPEFELVAAGPLSITCFRYKPVGMADDKVDALNKALQKGLDASGKAFVSSTEIDGRFVLRACIVNFRTTDADLDVLLDAAAEAGKAELKAKGDSREDTKA
ncbi:MAG TPA: pyridoxal-dependent decarboxylase [Candidatus Limnocylindrales bacterium]|nr:pyridoxal-dependent decarboxylase [Candidatus Limnocylindrales bacterium]